MRTFLALPAFCSIGGLLLQRLQRCPSYPNGITCGGRGQHRDGGVLHKGQGDCAQTVTDRARGSLTVSNGFRCHPYDASTVGKSQCPANPTQCTDKSTALAYKLKNSQSFSAQYYSDSGQQKTRSIQEMEKASPARRGSIKLAGVRDT